ncbi:MAG: glycosyltransferase family 4 protein [Desulfatirhabdiaceae bacterium]
MLTTGGKRTVLHVIDALNIGGAQELVTLLADKTPYSLYQTIVCAIQPDRAMQSRIESTGAVLYCLDRKRPSILCPCSFISYFYQNIRDIVSICRKHRVDVVHCHLSDAEFIGILAGWLYGAERIITTVHYPALLPKRKTGDIRNHLRILTTRVLYHLTDAVIAVSKDTSDQLKSLFHVSPDKIHVIINGIDVEAFHATQPAHGTYMSVQASPEQRIITSVGRLMPPKGHCYLIEAIPYLVESFPNLKLLLAGDGDLRESLTHLSHGLNVDQHISFLGSRNDIADILAITDVFVLPSVSEGTSMALLEAMSAAKPIVATDIPGNRAILKDKHNCLLVPPGDAKKIAGAVAWLLDHSAMAAGYGKQAYLDVYQSYNIGQTVSRLMTLWG